MIIIYRYINYKIILQVTKDIKIMNRMIRKFMISTIESSIILIITPNLEVSFKYSNNFTQLVKSY